MAQNQTFCAMEDTSWWYADETEQICGPFQATKLASLFIDGVVDGLTLVTEDATIPKERWTQIAEVDAIRSAISAADAPESGDETNGIDSELEKLASSVPDAVEHCKEAENGTTTKPVKQEKNVDAGKEAKSEEPNIDAAAAIEVRRLARKRRRAAKRLQERAATSVYVTGLPADATEDEVTAYFAKCGIILPSADTGRARVKLYEDENGRFKGDALVTYAMAPSVENAVTLLDGAPLRYGGTSLHVQRASFEHKDAAQIRDAVRRAAGEGTKRQRRVGGAQALVQEALSWAEDGQGSSRAQRIVILRNVFDAANADYDLIREDMQDGCADFGDVKNITVFEGSPEGAVAVKFATATEAKECIRVMDNRWYDKRRISAVFFDGVTDYRVKDNNEETDNNRDREWASWLASEPGDADKESGTR